MPAGRGPGRRWQPGTPRATRPCAAAVRESWARVARNHAKVPSEAILLAFSLNNGSTLYISSKYRMWQPRSCGLMDKASASGAEDSRFESWLDHPLAQLMRGAFPQPFCHPSKWYVFRKHELPASAAKLASSAANNKPHGCSVDIRHVLLGLDSLRAD